MGKIRLHCPDCGRKLSATEGDLGRVGRCPTCHARIDITRAAFEERGSGTQNGADEAAEETASIAIFEIEGLREGRQTRFDESSPAIEPSEPFVDDDREGKSGTSAARAQDHGAASPGAPWLSQVPTGAPDYPLLRFVTACFKVIGGVGLVLAALGFLAVIALAVSGRADQAPVMRMLAVAGAVFMGGAILYAAGELLAVLPDIRAEAWRQTHLLRAILRRLIEDKRTS